MCEMDKSSGVYGRGIYRHQHAFEFPRMIECMQCCKCKKRSGWTLSERSRTTRPPHDLHDRGGGGCKWKKKVGGRRPPSSKISGWTRVDARPPCTDPIRGWTPSTLKNKWVDAVHLRPPTLAALWCMPCAPMQVRYVISTFFKGRGQCILRQKGVHAHRCAYHLTYAGIRHAYVCHCAPHNS